MKNIADNMSRLGLEYREGQFHMMNLLKAAFKENHNILIEAQTGTGKTLAYLLGALYSKDELGLERIIITTKTKILQDQLLKKDIPLAKQVYKNFKAKVLYGSNEYLCLHVIDSYKNTAPADVSLIEKRIQEGSFLIEDFKNLPLNDLMPSEITRDPDTCKKKSCPFYEECFYYKEYAKAKEAEVLVVNHHLLLTNIETEFKLFGTSDILIMDEGHSLEDTCIEFWGTHLTYYGVRKLFLLFFNPAKRIKGLRSRLKQLQTTHRSGSAISQILPLKKNASDGYPTLTAGLNELEAFIEEEALTILRDMFINVLNIQRKGYNQSFKISIDQIVHLCNELQPLLEHLLEIFGKLSYTVHTDNDEEMVAIAKKLYGTLTTVKFFLEITETTKEQEGQVILWADTDEDRKRGIKNVKVHASPIDISESFKQKIIENFLKVSIISATLSIQGDFSYILSMLGLSEDTESVALKSDFNLQQQQKIFVPHMYSAPNTKEFLDEGATYIKHIVEKLHGRTLILTTSHYNLNYLYTKLKNEGMHIIKQGEKDRTELLNYKRDVKESVLIGTSGLWEGIDIKGDALQGIVIVKLPFDVPSDPLIKARCDYMENKGLNPFMHFSLPRALLRFKQGVGRLIRSKEDTGLITILDPRVIQKNYGKFFINALEGTYIKELEEV